MQKGNIGGGGITSVQACERVGICVGGERGWQWSACMQASCCANIVNT